MTQGPAGYANIGGVLEARPPSVAEVVGQPAVETSDGERADVLASEVARAVRELRAAAGLSERAAARALGTSQTQLRRMEDPRYLPSLRSLARVATVYGHRLRIHFEPRVPPGGSRVPRGGSRVPRGGSKDRQPPRPAKPASRAKPAAARAKRAPATRSTRPRPRRRG